MYLFDLPDRLFLKHLQYPKYEPDPILHLAIVGKNVNHFLMLSMFDVQLVLLVLTKEQPMCPCLTILFVPQKPHDTQQRFCLHRLESENKHKAHPNSTLLDFGREH